LVTEKVAVGQYPCGREKKKRQSFAVGLSMQLLEEEGGGALLVGRKKLLLLRGGSEA